MDFTGWHLYLNGFYSNGWYDASAVMIRRLVETLIIEVFEKHGDRIEDTKRRWRILLLTRPYRSARHREDVESQQEHEDNPSSAQERRQYVGARSALHRPTPGHRQANE